VSPTYDLHPEFGLFCPSPRFRRKVRVVLALLALFVVVGALALKASHDPDIDGALMIARGEEARSNADTSQAAMLTKTAERSRSPEGRKTSCEGAPWSYIDGNCIVRKAHKRQSARAANTAARISELPLGRGAPPPPVWSTALVNSTGAAPNTAGPTLAMSVPPGPATTASTKVHKPSRSRNGGRDLVRDWNWHDDPWSARAYALPSNRNPSDRYGRPWGWSW
jgi:hypothetical protein